MPLKMGSNIKTILVQFSCILGFFYTLPTWLYLSLFGSIFLSLTAFLSGSLFDHIPHIADSHAQYAHARIFLSGHLYDHSHTLRHFFDIQWFVNDGKYYSQFPPGHILMLAIGHLFGFPWLVNPIVGTATLFAVYLLGKEIGNEAVGRISAVLMLISPFIIFMSSEFMNHATCLLMITLFFFLFLRGKKIMSTPLLLAAGVAASFAFITRPQATIMLLLPVIFYLLRDYLRRDPYSKKVILLMTIGFFPLFLFLLYFNWQTTGDPFLMGYQKLQPTLYSMTNPNIFSFNAESWSILLKKTKELNSILFCWPISSLLFVFLLFTFRAEGKYGVQLIVCTISAFFGLLLIGTAYFDNIFGPRYLYETSGILIVLSALFIRRIPAILRARFGLRFPIKLTHSMSGVLLIALYLAAYPQIRHLYTIYSNNYWEGNASYYRWIDSSVEKPALVFIRDDYAHYRYVFFTFPPNEKSDIIFAKDFGYDNEILADNYFPHRKAYVVTRNEIIKFR